MKRHILFFVIFILISCIGLTQIMVSNHSKAKKLVTIPVLQDTSAGDNFCICKIVTYASVNNLQRTDAIFAASTPERFLSKKNLLRNIDYEIQQALVFFDGYELVRQYASAVNCNSLLKYLKEQQEQINRFTVLLPSYASR